MATTQHTATSATDETHSTDETSSARIQSRLREKQGRHWSIDAAILLLCAVIGAFGTKAFIAQVFSIPSGSMRSTVAPDERVIAEKISYRTRAIGRGDVVFFDGNGIFAPPVPGDYMFVKRVIGLPGERVACCDPTGKLTVDGVALEESEYVYPGNSPSTVSFDVIVPIGKLWLMGDHRSDSADSRAYLGAPGGGFVPEERVVGRATAVVWPISSARSIDLPTYRR